MSLWTYPTTFELLYIVEETDTDPEKRVFCAKDESGAGKPEFLHAFNVGCSIYFGHWGDFSRMDTLVLVHNVERNKEV